LAIEKAEWLANVGELSPARFLGCQSVKQLFGALKQLVGRLRRISPTHTRIPSHKLAAAVSARDLLS